MMPVQGGNAGNPKKRKRTDGLTSKSVKKTVSKENEDNSAKIFLLEEKILESQRNFNSIATLLQFLDEDDIDGTRNTAAIALCRVFCRLMAAGKLTKTKESSENAQTVSQWLLERFEDFKRAMCTWIRSTDAAKQSLALTLLMQYMKEEARQKTRLHGTFANLLKSLLDAPAADSACNEFVIKYVNVYDDIRYFTFHAIGYVAV